MRRLLCALVMLVGVFAFVPPAGAQTEGNGVVGNANCFPKGEGIRQKCDIILGGRDAQGRRTGTAWINGRHYFCTEIEPPNEMGDGAQWECEEITPQGEAVHDGYSTGTGNDLTFYFPPAPCSLDSTPCEVVEYYAYYTISGDNRYLGSTRFAPGAPRWVRWDIGTAGVQVHVYLNAIIRVGGYDTYGSSTCAYAYVG